MFCYDKPVFATIKHDKTFVATKMIFVAAPANDKTQHDTDLQRQTDFCIKMDSGESHFNVLVTGGGGQCHKDNVHRPQLLKREDSRSGNRTKVLLLTRLTPHR